MSTTTGSRARDALGALSDSSTSASIVVEGVDMSDVNSTISDAIQEAIDTANDALSSTGGSVTWAMTEPTTPDGVGKPVGGLWWVHDLSGKVSGLYEWSGTAWVSHTLGPDSIATAAITDAKIATGAVLEAAIADAAIATAKLQDSSVEAAKIANLAVGTAKIADAAIVEAKIGNLAVSSAKIADAAIVTAKIGDAQIINAKIADATITNAKIANLDAGKITAGTIDAARIAANTITADKIAIADFTNYAAGSDFEDATKVPWSNYGASNPFRPSTAQFHSGTASMVLTGGTTGTSQLNTTIPAQEGDKFYVEFWARRSASWNGLVGNSKLRFGYNDGTISALSYAAADLVADTWTKRSATITAPANNTSISVQLVNNDATAGFLWLDDIVIRRVSGGELIVDGAIIASKIAADAVTANAIAANAVTANAIDAGAVTAAKISATAIDGKTITGALVRSAASGARTELNSSGIRVLNSSGTELVRIGYGIATGMSVRNPSSGTLTPLADVAFGIKSASATDVNLYTYGPNMTGTFTRHAGDALELVFTAWSSGGILTWGEHWGFNYGDFGTQSPIVRVQPRINGTALTAANGGPIFASGFVTAYANRATETNVDINGSAAINTTPGTSYTIQLYFGFTTGSQSSGVTSSLSNRFIQFTPTT